MIRRRVIVVVALAILIFTATSSILSELQSAPAAFAGSGDRVIYQTGAPTIFSSQVDVGIVPLLLSQEEVRDAWPEIVTFSAFGDESFVVRGMDIGALDSSDRLAIAWAIDGEREADRGTAVIGSKLMDRLDIQPPYVVPLSGSYTSRLEIVTVAGSFEAGSYLDDEMIVSEEVARYLCNMPADSASLIAVEAEDTSWLEAALSPEDARFALFDVRASKTTVVPGESVSMTMEVRNWGTVDGQATVRISDDGVLICEETVSLTASASETIDCPLTFESKGIHSLKACISGDFQSEATVNISVVDPYLTISAPSRALLDSPFQVTVGDNDGDPVPNAEVSYSMGDIEGTVSTDASGGASITPPDTGVCLLVASHAGLTTASASVEVIDISTYPDEFLPEIRSFVLLEEVVSESDDVVGNIVVENAGALEGTAEVRVMVDSSLRTLVAVSLAPAEQRSVPVTVSGLGVGVHVIQVGTFSHEVEVQPWFADEPDLVQLVLRYGGAGVLSSSASIPVYQAAKISEGNVAVALFSVGAISALLAGLAISAAFAKEIRENRRALGILRTVGASRRQVKGILLPQALLSGLVGAVVGVAAGLALTVWLTRSGTFIMFGHTLAFEPNASLLLFVAGGAAAIAVASSLVSAEIATRETPISSIRDLEAVPSEEIDIEGLLADE